MDTFLGLLEEVTHDGFMAGVAGLSTLTLVILAIAVRRILPKHKHDSTLPQRRELP
ncbi:hypothetical protein NG819_08290 [Pseudarthrobacter sp. Fe7]|nr:hypothetical protein NG819_08290 [Pseudarthrobacter sp. Fe7]